MALAQDVGTLLRSEQSIRQIVFANSIQSGSDTPYGRGKTAASRTLAEAAADSGAGFVDVRLPNLFGEHGRPRYNSFVATFADALLNGEAPTIMDRPVNLLHGQGAAQALLEGLTGASTCLTPGGTATTVQAVFEKLAAFNRVYVDGNIPLLASTFDVDLFNTMRAARLPSSFPIALSSRTDQRGTLFEVVRSHGGEGQTFISTTKPGITRGEHFHLRKIERFVVLDGVARISMRRLFTDEVFHFDVDGRAPVAIDMPTMWAHNITNTGTAELMTLFWTNQLFDPSSPDTFPEVVDLFAGGNQC